MTKELFIPDNAPCPLAMERTTHLCIAAHQDDIEIMAASPIVECFGKQDRWFGGVVVTDGAGSPRSGIYERYTDEQMKVVRAQEQKTAAVVGQYSAQWLLNQKSSDVKDPNNEQLYKEIAKIISIAKPEILFTHNLADKHDTHVAVALRVIKAVRSLPEQLRPKKIYSLEVWRGLDWLCDNDKMLFDTSNHPNLQAALLGVFDSQIAGGKRYDDAAMGRRIANATFFASHNTDNFLTASYGLDITDLVNSDACPCEFISKYIENFKKEVTNRVEAFL